MIKERQSVGAVRSVPLAGRWRVTVGTFLVAVAVCLPAVTARAGTTATAIVWSSVALALYCGTLLLLTSAVAGHDGLGLASWKIGSWSLVWVGGTFGLATISWISPQSGVDMEISPASILRALWLIAVAMTAFAVGYGIGPHAAAERQASRLISAQRRRFSDEIRSPWVPWALFAVGTAAQVVLTAITGRFGYVGDAASVVTAPAGYGQLFAVAALCGPLSVAAAAARVYRTRAGGTRTTLAVLFVAEVAIGAASGGKQSYIVAILAVLVPRAAARKNLPVGTMAVALLVFVLIIIPFNQTYRSDARGTVTLSTGQAVADAPAILGQVISSDQSLSVISDSVIYLAQRVREIDSPAIIVQRTPGQIPYRSAVQLIEAPIEYLVPRVLWPHKPVLAAGYEFSQQYFELPSSVYTSTAITPEGDLYRYGGWVPVIAGMLVLGCGIRILDDVLDVRASMQAAFLVIILCPDLIKSEDDWITLLTRLPALVILWAVVVPLAFARTPRKAAGTSWGEILR